VSPMSTHLSMRTMKRIILSKGMVSKGVKTEEEAKEMMESFKNIEWKEAEAAEEDLITPP